MPSPRVVVLGGQGVLGTMIAAAFRGAGWATVRTGRRPGPGEDFRLVDLAAPQPLRALLETADLVVNTVPDRRLTAERAVLDGGGLLINVAALSAAAQRLGRQDPAARGTVVMNAGIAPGVTNLVAAGLLADHPEADRIVIAFTVSGRGSVGHAGAAFAQRGLAARRHHHTSRIDLPAPFGPRRCLGFAEDENGWLSPGLTGRRQVDTYMCLRERGRHRALLLLNAARAIARLPRTAFLTGVTEPTREAVAHRVAVHCEAREVAARTVRCRGDYRGAAASTLVLATALLARAASLPTGLVALEHVLTVGDVRTALSNAGVAVVDEPLPA